MSTCCHYQYHYCMVEDLDCANRQLQVELTLKLHFALQHWRVFQSYSSASGICFGHRIDYGVANLVHTFPIRSKQTSYMLQLWPLRYRINLKNAPME